MGTYVSEKGFKESKIFHADVSKFTDNDYYVFFEYGIQGDNSSIERRVHLQTEEDANKMLQELKRSFHNEAGRASEYHSSIKNLTTIITIVGVLFLLGFFM